MLEIIDNDRGGKDYMLDGELIAAFGEATCLGVQFLYVKASPDPIAVGGQKVFTLATTEADPIGYELDGTTGQIWPTDGVAELTITFDLFLPGNYPVTFRQCGRERVEVVAVS